MVFRKETPRAILDETSGGGEGVELVTGAGPSSGWRGRLHLPTSARPARAPEGAPPTSDGQPGQRPPGVLAAEPQRGPDLLRLANAPADRYPRQREDKRLLDAMVLAVPG